MLLLVRAARGQLALEIEPRSSGCNHPLGAAPEKVVATAVAAEMG